MDYGYARASTNSDKQDIGRQKRELMAIGIKEHNIFWEYESGSHEDREKLQQLLATVKQGDTIACTEVSRLSRSTKQLCEILEFVEKNRIKLIVGTFVVDCRNDDIDPMTMGMLRMMAVFAQMERDITIQRIKSGMDNARAKGKHIGRNKTTVDDIPSIFFRYYPQYTKGNINLSEFARLTSLSRNSVYKYLKIVDVDSAL
ncbi:recombinase family protein [Lachnospiraceae bacterium MD335]|nr:recombinase family protein [Lachnospiraceae bacterium MD335]